MLGTPIRRWTVAERNLRIGTAPEFEYPPPLKDELDRLVVGYIKITSDPIASWRKRNLVATCYRVHGEDFLDLVEEMFAARGTATNLLGEIRCLQARKRLAVAPTAAVPEAQVRVPTKASARADKTVDCGCDIGLLRPGLVYCDAHRPQFDGKDVRRHDRRRSNPEAARFFSDVELGGPAPVRPAL